MTEKRYFERKWEGEYYIFDSQVISEKEFDEKVQYEDYRAFEDSMTGDDVINRLNELQEENENITLLAQHNYEESKRIINRYVDKIKELKKKNKELKEWVSEVDNELEIRDIVCGAGKFRLEEWGKHRYHQFYKGDEELEDETVVIMLMELEKENNKLKKETNELKQQFILLLKKLGKKNVQCSFCEHGEHYSELVDGYYEPRFICHKKGQEYTQRSFCEDWKIKVKE